MLAEGLQLLSTPFSPRLGDLTISIVHSVVQFTGSTNIATSDGYSRRWTSCSAMVKCWWRLSTGGRTKAVVAVCADSPWRNGGSLCCTTVQRLCCGVFLNRSQPPMKPGGTIGSKSVANAFTKSTKWHANHISRIEKIPQMFSGRRRSQIQGEHNRPCHT